MVGFFFFPFSNYFSFKYDLFNFLKGKKNTAAFLLCVNPLAHTRNRATCVQAYMSSGYHKWCISQLDLIPDVLLMDSRGKSRYLKEKLSTNAVVLRILGCGDVNAWWNWFLLMGCFCTSDGKLQRAEFVSRQKRGFGYTEVLLAAWGFAGCHDFSCTLWKRGAAWLPLKVVAASL